MAVRNNHDDVCRLLIQHNANIFLQDGYGKTPLDVSNNNSTGQILLDAVPCEIKDEFEEEEGQVATHPQIICTFEEEETIPFFTELDFGVPVPCEMKDEFEEEESIFKEEESVDEELNFAIPVQKHHLFDEIEAQKSDLSYYETDALLQQLEICALEISSLATEKTELVNKCDAFQKQNVILQQQIYKLQQEVKVLKENQFAAMLSEFRLPHQRRYDDLLKELLSIQNSLLSERDAEKKVGLIVKRSAIRRTIRSLIDKIFDDAQTQLVPQATKIVKNLMDKKLEYLDPVKKQLDNDIEMEAEWSKIGSSSLETLQIDLSDSQSDLTSIKRLLQHSPDDQSLKNHAANIKAKIEATEAKIEKYKQLSQSMLKRNNPLFGFPELQAAVLNSLQQEKIKDLNEIYTIQQKDVKYYVGIRKSDQSKVFIKIFSKLNAWKQFKNEVEALRKLNHQCVISIDRALYDDHLYYIEMPFIENGNLLNWLFKSNGIVPSVQSKNIRTPFEVQMILRLIIQTIDYIHENGVIHRDLKLENIMVRSDNTPVIIDFDLSKANKNGQTSSVSTMKGGTQGYMDPAVQWDNAPLNTKSETYSFGVILLKCFSKHPLKANVPMSNRDVPDLKTSDLIVEDADLIQLLKRCLHRNQDKRPSAREILYSPFFLKHLHNDKEDQKKEQTDTRIMAFKKYLLEKRLSSSNSAPILITLREEDIVSDLTKYFIAACNTYPLLNEEGDDEQVQPIYHQLSVKFQHQDGVDAGALTTSMFRKYFEQVVVKKMVEKGSSCYHICCDNSSITTSAENNRELMIGFGLVLAKCLYEGRSIGDMQLSNALLKFLLAKDTQSIPVSLVDLEQFDLKMSNEMNNMHLMEDVSQLSLDFSGLKPNGDQIELTNQNLDEYISLQCKQVMIESRRQNLTYVREGFYKMEELKEHFQMLHVNDYSVLLTGEQMIDIHCIVDNCIEIIGSDDEDDEEQISIAQYTQFREWLTQVLKELSQEEFKQFLLFCTGYCSTQTKDKLFENGRYNNGFASSKINVKIIPYWSTNRLPEAHVCFYLLDMPLYDSKEQMEQKLKQALANTNDFYAMR